MSDEWVLVPRVPTKEMLDAGVDHRLHTAVGGNNKWPDDTAKLYTAMLAAAPKPQPSADDVAVLDDYLIEYAKLIQVVPPASYKEAAEKCNNMRAAVLSRMGADRDAVIEECARVCEQDYARSQVGCNPQLVPERIASAIRALKGKK